MMTDRPSLRCALPAWFLLVPLVGIAWWLRLATIAPYELGTDGGLSVGLATGPLRELFAYNARDVHPPLYYLMLKGWIDVAGVSWISLKWLSSAGGIVAVVASTRWLRSAAGGSGGWVGGTLAAVTPAAVIASAAVRDFTCGLGATMLAVLAFWILIQEPKRPRMRLFLAVATAVAGMLWYFHLPVFALQLVMACFWRPARAALRALLAGAAAWIPWSLLAGPSLLQKVVHGIDSSGGQGGKSSAPIAEMLAVAGGWYPGPIPAAVAVSVTFGLALLGGAIGWRLGRKRLVAVALAWAIASGLALWYVNAHWSPPAGLDRYGLAVTPFIVALAVAMVRRPVAGVAVSLCFLAVTLPTLAPMPRSSGSVRWSSDPGLEIVMWGWHAGDGVAFDSVDRFGYFVVRGGCPEDSFAAQDNGRAFLRQGSAERIAGTLPNLEAQHQRVWYVSDNDDITDLALALESTATLVQAWQTAGDYFTPHGVVHLYTTNHPAATSNVPSTRTSCSGPKFTHSPPS